MPARKSNPPAADGSSSPPRDGLSVEDLSLPRTMVQRLAKGVLPPNTSIQKDALLALSKSATVFVSYLTHQAHDLACMKDKKTIQPRDVLDAIEEAELEGFLDRLEKELERYNATQCDKRNSYRRKVREEKAVKALAAIEAGVVEMGQGAAAGAAGVNGHARVGDEPPAAKKMRRGEAEAEDEGETDVEQVEQGEDGADEEQDQEDDVEEDEEVEGSEDEEDGERRLVEDPIEEREGSEDEDDVLDDGDDSD
ncbi:hypothetical protein H2201_001206 [Coniosporium apollinis]|uniref:DNA polymerase epsilon subunit D n=1 Tax=Coniosporium apollinis TaxID=61459 RepID=A0ABQ9P1S2_9PEZI|nr:hypothetical protein H2201_001206 [Coniosporium apollinis]